MKPANTHDFLSNTRVSIHALSGSAPDKGQMARILAEGHRRIGPTISRVFRIVSDREQDTNEPVKLLEVNPETLAAGIVPIVFGADPPSFPYASVVVEVTEAEFEEILDGSLHLPDGWRLDELLCDPLP